MLPHATLLQFQLKGRPLWSILDFRSHTTSKKEWPPALLQIRGGRLTLERLANKVSAYRRRTNQSEMNSRAPMEDPSIKPQPFPFHLAPPSSPHPLALFAILGETSARAGVGEGS